VNKQSQTANKGWSSSLLQNVSVGTPS